MGMQDQSLLFCKAQVFGTGADYSTYSVDAGAAARRWAKGEPLFLEIAITGTGTAGSIVFEIVQYTDATAGSSGTVAFTFPAVTTSATNTLTRAVFPWPDIAPQTATMRYWGLKVTATTAGGTITAGIVTDAATIPSTLGQSLAQS
jgi:hypothetical protein